MILKKTSKASFFKITEKVFFSRGAPSLEKNLSRFLKGRKNDFIDPEHQLLLYNTNNKIR